MRVITANLLPAAGRTAVSMNATWDVSVRELLSEWGLGTDRRIWYPNADDDVVVTNEVLYGHQPLVLEGVPLLLFQSDYLRLGWIPPATPAT